MVVNQGFIQRVHKRDISTAYDTTINTHSGIELHRKVQKVPSQIHPPGMIDPFSAARVTSK